MRHVKLIDLGKVTLVDDPVTYSIRVGSKKHDQYNSFHCHLGNELRNISGSSTSFKSDIYSLGYCFGKISTLVNSDQLSKFSKTMMYDRPTDRPELDKMLIRNSKI